MYRLGIIEESLENAKTLDFIKPCFFSQRIENMPEDVYPIWHINEYHVPDEKIEEILNVLKEDIKQSWYIHAFSDRQLFVVMRGRYFEISLQRDNTWDEMIQYGIEKAKIERHFIENIPLEV